MFILSGAHVAINALGWVSGGPFRRVHLELSLETLFFLNELQPFRISKGTVLKDMNMGVKFTLKCCW